MERARRTPSGIGPSKRRRMGLWAGLVLWGAFSLAFGGLLQGPGLNAQSGAAAKPVLVLDTKAIIAPALGDYLIRSIEEAQGSASLIVLEMDTPGGLVTTTRDIIQAILASDVPVATFVSPAGARAASAGTFILYGSHIAAMAPGTNVGAATPVQMGTPAPAPAPAEEDKKLAEGEKTAPSDEEGSDEAGGEAAGTGEENVTPDGAAPKAADAAKPSTALELKALNDAAAYIRALAELRGRNAEWAEKAVREASSLSYAEALEMDVIDYVAENLADLLAQIDGKTVTTGAGEITLATAGAVVERLEPTLVQRILMAITDPNIAFILMQLGTIGLLMEVYNPGSFFPGVVGLICLVLGLYALSVLPTNTAGIALFVLGGAFVGAEFFVPSGGILGVGGLIAMALGAFFLFDTDVPELQISKPLILTVVAVTGVALFFVASYAGTLRAKKPMTGVEGLVGQKGRVIRWSGLEGHINADGENWRARAQEPLEPGDEIVITGMDGLVALVARA